MRTLQNIFLALVQNKSHPKKKTDHTLVYFSSNKHSDKKENKFLCSSLTEYYFIFISIISITVTLIVIIVLHMCSDHRCPNCQNTGMLYYLLFIIIFIMSITLNAGMSLSPISHFPTSVSAPLQCLSLLWRCLLYPCHYHHYYHNEFGPQNLRRHSVNFILDFSLTRMIFVTGCLLKMEMGGILPYFSGN